MKMRVSQINGRDWLAIGFRPGVNGYQAGRP